MDLLSRLQRELDGAALSRSETRIARAILDDFEFAVNATITGLANRTNVSPPTITRFCRRLGCDSFADFRVRLARSAHVGMRYLKPAPQAVSPADVTGAIIAGAQGALFRLHEQLEPARLQLAAAQLSRAGMIYAFGSGGNSSMIAQELQNRLFRLGLRITASSDHAMQMMLAAAARADADVLIGSSLSGRNAELVRVFTLAREAGVRTIALTQPESPVAAAASLVIPIGLPEDDDIYRPTATRYAFLAAVDILANLVALECKPEATAVLRQIKQQLVAHRDGDDRQMLGD